MHSFEAGGHAWELRLNVATVKRVLDVCGVDLLAVLNEAGRSVIEQLIASPVALVDVLHCLCASQCETRGMSPEDFGGMFAGDEIEAATQSLIQELVDFFPPRRRKALAAMMQKVEAVEEAGTRAAMEQIAKIDPEELVATALARIESGK